MMMTMPPPTVPERFHQTMGTQETFYHRLLRLRDLPGNNDCADCSVNEPTYASVNIGVYLCQSCAEVHRTLGSVISQVVPLDSSSWNETFYRQMEKVGNLRAKRSYEKTVPVFYRRSKFSDPPVLREQWIRAKYERKEFRNGAESSLRPYEEGQYSCWLWKQGRDNKKFEHRKFVLSDVDNCLKYYVKENAKEPKASLDLDRLNVAFVAEKMGNMNGVQVTFEHNGSTRNLFVYAEEGKDIVYWYNAIRAAKLKRRIVAFPTESTEASLAHDLTTDFAKEGWVQKTGPRPTDGWKKRWMTLEGRKLMYFSEPMDAFPKGELVVGSLADGFKILEGVPPERSYSGFAFTLRTPERSYHFSCATVEEKTKWMETLKKITEKELTAQEQRMQGVLRRR